MARNYRQAMKIDERNEAARQAEKNHDVRKATQLYEQNIRQDYADKFAFDRLMIIYRKQKKYKEELKVINRGLEVFQTQMENRLAHSLKQRIKPEALRQLSKAIINRAGLKDEDLLPADPVGRWMKRKLVVNQKLKKTNPRSK